MKQFLKKLVQADSTTQRGELAVARIISAQLAQFGIDADVGTWDDNRANVTAQIPSTGRRNGLLFAAHLDVVPPGLAEWKNPPFSAIETNGRIHGRGSADMKGGITAIVTAITEIVKSGAELQGDIIFLGAAGEETDSCGVKKFLSNYKNPSKLAGIIIPEPTDFEIVTAHRGMLWLEVTTKGKTAHGSTPHLGINAITSIKALLDELEHYKIPFEPHPLLGDCSISINKIAGGKAINVVPDSCTIAIDLRTLPVQNHQDIINDFKKIFAKLKQKKPQFDADVSVIRSVKALETDQDCGFVKDFCSTVKINETKAVGFTTDGPHLVPLGAPIVIFGPGKPNLCHKPDEYIDIDDVEKAVDYYKNIILKFLT